MLTKTTNWPVGAVSLVLAGLIPCSMAQQGKSTGGSPAEPVARQVKETSAAPTGEARAATPAQSGPAIEGSLTLKVPKRDSFDLTAAKVGEFHYLDSFAAKDAAHARLGRQLDPQPVLDIPPGG